MAEDSVAEAADMAEGGVALVCQLLQTQHGTVTTVSERSLQELEDLIKPRTDTSAMESNGIMGKVYKLNRMPLNYFEVYKRKCQIQLAIADKENIISS